MARRRRKLIVRDRKKTAFRIAIAAVSLIALLGAAVLTFFIVRSCGVRMTLRELPLVSSDLLGGTGDGLLYVRGDRLNFLSFKDEDENFTKTLTGASAPKGVTGTEGVKIVWSEDAVQAVGGSFDMNPEGVVRAVRCGASHAAVCARRPNGDEQILVYTSVGQLIKTFDFPKGTLVDFGFSEASDRTLWTMRLDTESGSPRTTVSTFDLVRMSSTGVISVSGQLIERVFFTSSSMYLAGTDSLIRCSASANREIYRVQLYGYRVEDISLAGDQPLLMLVPRGADPASPARSVRLLSVAQKDVADATVYNVTLPEGVIGCSLQSGSLAVTTPASVTLYSPKGLVIETQSLGETPALSAQKLDERHILLERSGDFVLLTVGK